MVFREKAKKYDIKIEGVGLHIVACNIAIARSVHELRQQSCEYLV